MEPKAFAWEAMPIGNFIASIILIVGIFAVLFFVIFKVAKRRASFFFLGSCAAVFIAAFLFNLTVVCILAGFLAAAGLAACFFANLGDLRKFVANPFSRQTAKAANFGIERIYDSQLLYKNIESAVISDRYYPSFYNIRGCYLVLLISPHEQDFLLPNRYINL